ncbi:MAG: InlB B-repeat-containing protein [Lachnospiraceae bacterium]|nr:InlB B-repeat-containing protein [Lachnospiraceae bacterium]
MKRKRLLAWLLTLAMCFSEIGSTGLKVMAAGEDEVNMEADVDDDVQPDDGAGFVKTAENTMLCTAGMLEPSTIGQDADPWSGSFVYYGNYQGKPVRYRVLDKDNGEHGQVDRYSLFLDCDSLLFKSGWEGVSLAEKTILDKGLLSAKEKEALVKSNGRYVNADNRLEGQIVYYLHRGDVSTESYGYARRGSRKKNVFGTAAPGNYWLRSCEKKNFTYGDIVTDKGEVANHRDNIEDNYVSPAFSIDLYNVAFSTAVKGEKGGVDTEYKLTLRFNGLPIKLADGKEVKIRGDEVSVPFNVYGDNAAYANAVSVLILDDEYKLNARNDQKANILYYGTLDVNGSFSANRTGSFKLPEGLSANDWGSAYRVYILPEVIGDAYKTDYAGTPVEIKKDSVNIIKTYKVTFDTKGNGTAPDAQMIEKGEKAVKPSDPQAKGYTFAGWYANQACTGDAFDFDTPITADITLYAKWIESTWTVSFDPNCEDAAGMPKQQKVMKGNTAVEPKDPTREGYAFGGWYKKAACDEASKYDFSKPVTGNIKLYAKWKELHEVSFDADGGSGNMPAVKVADGDYYTLPECGFTAPDKKYFIGWMKGSALKYSGAAVQITSDTVFKAYWGDYKYHTVEFIVDSETMKVEEVRSGDCVSQPEDPADKEGMSFMGWYVSTGGLGEDYKFDFTTEITKNLVLYAKWRDEAKYHITVNCGLEGGGTVTVNEGHEAYVSAGDDVTIKLTPDEYFDFDYLYNVPFESMGKAVPETVKRTDEGVIDNTTYYTYTFKFPNVKNLMYGSEFYDCSIEAYFTKRADHEHDLEIHPGKKHSCTVSGNMAWAECKICGHKYTWNEESETIGFDISGYPDDFVIEPAGHTDVVMIEAKEPDCTVSGNLAYAICNDCGTMWWNNNMGEEITMDDVILPIDVNAHEWDPATVTYTWADDMTSVSACCICKHNAEHRCTEEVGVTRTVVKEATCEEDGIADYTSDAFTDPLFEVQTKTGVAIEKTGHDYLEPFYEWSADLSAVSAVCECSRDASHKISETVAPKVTEMDGYKKYTATFTNERFEEQVRDIAEVTFDMNGVSASDVPNIQKVDLNDPAVIPYTSPSAEGYIFTGWYSDEDCTKVYDFDTPITKKTVIYAGWLSESATVFTVSFNMMGHGVAIDPVKVEDGKKLSRPVDPKASGVEFGGWYTEEECKNAYDFNAAVTKDFTLYAKWSEKAEPDPVKGGRSALDPLPEILSDTEDIYLVKGQKFDIPDGWSIARDDKASKRIISISKKGKFTAKKTGDAQMIFGSRTVRVHVYKPAMAKKSYKLEALGTQLIELKDYPADKMAVLWYSASPDVATVDEDGKVTAHAKGSAKITAYINGSAYTCTVKVTEKNAVAKERTMHITSGKSKTISVKVPGVKKLEWKSASDNIASVKKNKVTANAPGKTILSASANETEYTIELYSENLSISSEDARFVKGKGENKYSLTLKKGDKIKLTTDASLDQAAVFKSSKPMVAFIDEDGNVEARSKGSGKFTTKLNGKTITITVKVEE